MRPGIAIVAAALLLAACSSKAKEAPPPPVALDARAPRADDAAALATAEEIEREAARSNWEMVIALFTRLPADSAARARLQPELASARQWTLENRQRLIDDARASRYCVGARKSAAYLARVLPGDGAQLIAEAEGCRSAPDAEAPPDYATARWEPLDAPGDAVFFLPDGAQRDPELQASLFDVYAAVVLHEPALGLRLEITPPGSRAPGPAEQAATAFVVDAFVARGVERDRITVMPDPRPGMRNLTVGMHVMVGRPGPGARPGPIPTATSQLVLGVSSGWDATAATLTRYERAGGRWQQIGEPIPASLGRAGSAWGRGLHGAGAPAGRAGPVKREGDGRAPAGVFRVLRAYGYADAPVAGTALSYDRVDASWRCVDDPASTRYNHILDSDGVTVDWKSAELMRRDDELYRWVIELDHNAAGRDAVAGDGSCIFFHVRERADDVTAGCTAMSRPELETLLAWLSPGAVYVLLPADERAALSRAWALP